MRKQIIHTIASDQVTIASQSIYSSHVGKSFLLPKRAKNHAEKFEMHTGKWLAALCRQPVADELPAVQLSMGSGDADGLPSD